MTQPYTFQDAEPVLSAQSQAALEQALKECGLLQAYLERLGLGVSQALESQLPPPAPSLAPLLVVAGSGRAGSSALAAALWLHLAGYPLRVLACAPKTKTPALNAHHTYQQLKKAAAGSFAPLSITTLSASNLQRALSQPRLSAVLVGLESDLDAPQLGELLSGSGAELICINSSPGVQARRTLAPFLSPELLYGPAAQHAGQLELLPRALAGAKLAEYAVAQRPSDAELGRLLPRRTADAHKGVAGRVWVVGGHPGTQGAPLLSAYAALRTGAGLVTVYSQETLPILHPEVMVQVGKLPAKPPAEQHFALAVGMGLGPQAAQQASAALRWKVPTVLDADALQPQLAGQGHAQVIWTPHPGEAARMLATSTQHVTADPLHAAGQLQRRYGGVVVLKGGPSTVATPQGTFVVRGGHPGMATAGMGDTLSGILAALLAQGLPATDAALVGTRLHALAGELAAERHHYGLMASDVSTQLGQAWLRLLESAALLGPASIGA